MLKIAAATVGILLVCLAVMTRKHPGIALGLVWCLYALEQLLQAAFPFFLVRGSLINISLFGIACFGALTIALRTKMFAGIRLPREAMWVLLLFGLTALSAVWAPDSYDSFRRLKDVVPYMLQFVLIAPFCVLDRNQLDKAVKVVIYFGCFILIGLALCPIINRGIVVDHGGVLADRVDANPLAIAGFAGYVILAAVFKVYGMKRKSGFLFLVHIGIIALALLVMARSGSRGQVVASVIAMVIWLPITARVAAKRSSFLAMALVLLVCGGLFYFVSNGADSARWQSEQLHDHAFGRLELASRLLEHWYDAGPMYWLVGLGTSASWSAISAYPHIVPLEVVAEEGLVGFGLFSAFCLAVIVGGFKMLQREEINAEDRVNLGLVLALFTFQLALLFKQGSMIGSSAFFGFGLTAGWFASHMRKEARRNRARRIFRGMVQNPYVGQMQRRRSEYQQ